MKTFDEWWNDKYGFLYSDDEIGSLKDIIIESWQAAQEVQRESDADLVHGIPFLKEQIRNNKVV
jgi:hypothetical protein